MKQSVFNLFFPYDEKVDSTIIYNTRTNALALLDKMHYEVLRRFIENNEKIKDEDFIQSLYSTGYLVDDEINELALLRYNMYKDRFSTHHIGLTIAPTMNCNFRCPYCYEKSSLQNKRMNSEVQNKVVSFVEGWAKFIHNLSIDWYGGEPLLEMDLIKNMSKQFIAICQEKGVQYNSSMVTNGYHLTPQIAKELKELKVENIQITIDGPEDIHNARRILANGQGTFKRIIRNICDSIDYLQTLTIRINTDFENQDRIDEVFAILKENSLSDKVRVYLGFVQSTDDYSSEKCMSTELFSKRNFNFIKDNGINIINTYPRLITCFCGADSVNNYVVDPDGNMYKCWEDIGKQDKILFNFLDTSEMSDIKGICKSFEYVMYDPTSDLECSTCKCLPICMGGCPNKRMLNKSSCTEKKYSLERYLQEYTNYILQQRNKK
jgi:uncharacterized protein